MKFSSWCFILVVGSQIQEHVSCRTIIFFFNRVIFILTKRQEMDNTLGSSKAVSVANKQLTRTCVVVTCVFIVTLGKSFYSHYRWSRNSCLSPGNLLLHFSKIFDFCRLWSYLLLSWKMGTRCLYQKQFSSETRYVKLIFSNGNSYSCERVKKNIFSQNAPVMLNIHLRLFRFLQLLQWTMIAKKNQILKSKVNRVRLLSKKIIAAVHAQ